MGRISRTMSAKHETPRYLRYADLVARGIVSNRMTLKNWVDRQNFPPGALVGPNMRLWSENAVQRWMDSRPVAPKATPNPKRRPGRPRKRAAADRANVTA